jgi:hypothetical protein
MGLLRLLRLLRHQNSHSTINSRPHFFISIIKNKQNDDRSQAGVETMLKKIQDERAILDAPLTNRVLLLAPGPYRRGH